MKKMEKCKTCKNCDKELSNENWVVCPKIPLEVIMSGTSENCMFYIKEEGGEIIT